MYLTTSEMRTPHYSGHFNLTQMPRTYLHDGWSQTIGSGFVVRCDWSVPDPALAEVATRELRMIEMMSYDIIMIVMMSYDVI